MWNWIIPKVDQLSVMLCLNNFPDSYKKTYLDNLYTENIHGVTILKIGKVDPSEKQKFEDDVKEKIISLRQLKGRSEVFVFDINYSLIQKEDLLVFKKLYSNKTVVDDLVTVCSFDKITIKIDESTENGSLLSKIFNDDKSLYPLSISVSKEFSQDAVVLNQYGMTRLLSIFIHMIAIADFAIDKKEFDR